MAAHLSPASRGLPDQRAVPPRRWPRDWVWIALLGVGMLLGGVLAWIVAATRVVLPYDEAFVGLSRAPGRQRPSARLPGPRSRHPRRHHDRDRRTLRRARARPDAARRALGSA